MGRSRSSKKKRSGRRGGRRVRAATPVADPAAAIHDELTRGRTKQALKAANAWRKASPGPAADDLYLEVAEARIAQMGEAGLFQAAAQLVDSVEARFPGRLVGADLLAVRAELRAGQPARAIRALAREDLPAEHRTAIEELLAEEVADPAVVAACDAVAPNHRLRREARAAAHAFEAATRGTRDLASQAGQTRIPRSSPFAPWQLLALAIEAAYRGERETVERIARKMPARARPARLLPALRALAGGPEPDDPSVAERTLLRRIGAGTASAVADLGSLEDAIDRSSDRLAGRLAAQLSDWFRARCPALHDEFVRLLHQAWYGAEEMLEDLARQLAIVGERDWERNQALAAEYEGDFENAVACWQRHLRFRAPPRHVSLIRLRQATLTARWSNGDDAFGCDCPECRATWADGPGDGEQPVDPIAFLRMAVEAHPTPDGWRRLADAHDETGDNRACEAALQSWLEGFRQDVEPALRLLRRAERRGAFRKALRLLEEAAARAPTHPEIREGRFRLRAQGALRRLAQQKAHLAVRDVEALRRLPGAEEPSRRLLLDVVAWLTAYARGDAEGLADARRSLVAQIGEGGAALAVREAAQRIDVRPAPAAPRLPPEPAAPPAPEAAHALALLERAHARAHERFVAGARWASPLQKAVKKGYEPPPEELEALCRWAHAVDAPALLFALSGQGLRRDGPRRHRFLLHRARSLADGGGAQDRALDCLDAAQVLARRVNDDSLAEEAALTYRVVAGQGAFGGLARALASLVGSESKFDPAEAAEILDSEARASNLRGRRRRKKKTKPGREPRSRARPHARRPRQKQPTPTGPTLFDLDPVPEEETR